MNVNEMIKIYNMGYAKHAKYCQVNGWRIGEYDHNEDYHWVFFEKGYDMNSKKIYTLSYFGEPKKFQEVIYYTYKLKEFDNFKNELLKKGFKIYHFEEVDTKRKFDEYRNKLYGFEISEDIDENEIKYYSIKIHEH